MPRRKTDPRYVERVGVLVEEGLAVNAIERQIRSEAEGQGRHDAPSEATVRRLAEQHRKLPSYERRELAILRWPGSFVGGALPWEAGEAALELLRHRDEAGLAAPTNRQAKWFWRLRLASRTMPVDEADTAARTLATVEFLTQQGHPGVALNESLQWRLAYGPWRRGDHGIAWEAACERDPARGAAVGFTTRGSVEEVNRISDVLREEVAAEHRPRPG